MSSVPATPEECARALTDALARQTEIFRAIAGLSARQAELIRQNDADALLRVLAEKQRLIGQREQVERSAAPLRTQWERVRERIPAARRLPVEKALEELRAVVTEVMAQEESARVLLESQQAQTTREVARVQTGKAMLKAYGNANKGTPGPARFQDKKG